MKFGFAIIGCGMIGRFHAQAIQSLDDAELVGCFDSWPESAERLAAEFDCRHYDSLEDLLADDAVTIVTICTPSGSHEQPTIAAAAAGKHVVVEKPLEVTVEKCDRMIAACEQAGVVLSTVFQSRFHEAPRLVKQAIDEGRFGKLVLANAYVKWFRTQEYYDSGDWRGTWEFDGGGALMNQAIHSVDLLCWFMGEVQSVAAISDTLAHQRIEVEDAIVANLRFANGALGSIEATTAAFPGALKRIEIYGTQGSAVIEEEDITTWEFSQPTEADKQILERLNNKTSSGGGAADPSAISFAGHAHQFEDVMDAIRDGRQPQVDGHEARKSVELINRIYDAAGTRTADRPE